MITIEGMSAATSHEVGMLLLPCDGDGGCCCTMETEGYCHDMRRKRWCDIMGFGMMQCREKERMLGERHMNR